jgi:hypothetical protein
MSMILEHHAFASEASPRGVSPENRAFPGEGRRVPPL